MPQRVDPADPFFTGKLNDLIMAAVILCYIDSKLFPASHMDIFTFSNIGFYFCLVIVSANQ